MEDFQFCIIVALLFGIMGNTDDSKLRCCVYWLMSILFGIVAAIKLVGV